VYCSPAIAENRLLAGVFVNLKTKIMITEIILLIIGASLICAACDLKRPKEYSLKIGSKWWWLQILLIVSGMLIYKLGF
jgi:hypothetical protein